MPFIGYFGYILVTSVTTFGFPLYFFSTHLSAAMFIKWTDFILGTHIFSSPMFSGGI